MELNSSEPIQLLAPTDADQFRRIEDKFLLPKEYSAELLKLLFELMQKDPQLQQIKVEKNKISSLYFESDQFRLLTDHLEGRASRFKIRMRTYHNADPSLSSHCIEFKEKSLGISSKKRIWIDSKNRQRILDRQPIVISKELLYANPRLNDQKLLKRLNLFNGHISKYRLKPTINITYHRTALELEKLRVTVDTGLTYSNWNPNMNMTHMEPRRIRTQSKDIIENFDPHAVCIAEVKHLNQFPEWLATFFESKNISKSSFSKYCWSLSSLLGKNLKLEPLLQQKIEVV